jgi:hypothetical protein
VKDSKFKGFGDHASLAQQSKPTSGPSAPERFWAGACNFSPVLCEKLPGPSGLGPLMRPTLNELSRYLIDGHAARESGTAFGGAPETSAENG